MLISSKVALSCLKRTVLHMSRDGTRTQVDQWLVHVNLLPCSYLGEEETTVSSLPTRLDSSLVYYPKVFSVSATGNISARDLDNHRGIVPPSLAGFDPVHTAVIPVSTSIGYNAIVALNELFHRASLNSSTFALINIPLVLEAFPHMCSAAHFDVVFSSSDTVSQVREQLIAPVPDMSLGLIPTTHLCLSAALSHLLSSIQPAFTNMPHELLYVYLRCVQSRWPNLYAYPTHSPSRVLLPRQAYDVLRLWLVRYGWAVDETGANRVVSNLNLVTINDGYVDPINIPPPNIPPWAHMPPSSNTWGRVLRTDSTGVISSSSDAPVIPVQIPTDYDLLRKLVRRSFSPSVNLPLGASAFDSVSLEALDAVLHDTFEQALRTLPCANSSLVPSEIKQDLQAAFIKSILSA